ncbi:hypothetical protein Q1695_008316 [Nippostrongylus brasiliensis]|nr:hypothetical protein Q1695_008316 [Nippostrongylus brasiliensis]
MEGMPRVPMLQPEPKIPANQYDEEFRLKIKEYILLHFQDDPSKYDNALTEIMNLKQNISNAYADVETACLLKRYYAQLLMMKNRFPMEEGDPIKVLFCWYDRAMDIAHSATYDDIGFELACVMYNIGAVHANVAVNETRESEDSIKNAFMHYQYAAWPLQHLRDKLNASKYASVDFDKELLTFFVNVLLGQAQECLLEKSLIDHRSNLVVAKLAIHLRDRYQECLRHLENSNLCDYVSSQKYKLWARTCAVKSEMYGCIAMIHMGCQADDDKKMGARYGYYKLANEHLTTIFKLAEKEDRDSMKASLSFLADVVGTKLSNAKKENEFIYHERVPGNEELCKDLEGLCKVRPLSFDPLDPSVGGEDLFGGLLPPGVIKAVSEYEEEKARLKREILEKVNQKEDELNAFLISLRIDEIDLEPDSSAPVLPDMLLERNAALTAQPDAIPRLLENLQKVGDLARDAGEKLSGLSGRLAEVDLPQITSDEGYKAIKKELERLNEHHQKARSNNVELHKALAAHSTNLHLLSLPIYELSSKLAGPSINAGSTPEGAALKRVLDKTREMQTQRAQLIQRFNDEVNNDNIAKKLLSERDSDHKETFSAELKKHEETLKYLEANMNAQEKILSALTEANADFSDYRKKIKSSLNTRSEHIMTLVTAYDVYCDVCQKVDDGRNFYLKLLDRLGKLTPAVEGIEAAFGAERQRREAEKRSLEEKMAAIKRASEAREAMADFSIGGVPTPGGRPRLGDYMQFYRNKINAGGAAIPAPPSNVLPPPHQAIPGLQQPHHLSPGGPLQQLPPVFPSEHPSAGPQLPSPAPSSVPDSATFFSPQPPRDLVHHPSTAPQHIQYSHAPTMPPSMSYAAQAVSQNPALNLPPHLQSTAHMSATVPRPAAHVPSQETFSQPMSNHVHTSLATQQPGVLGNAAVYGQQYPQHHGATNMPSVAVSTPIPSINASAAVPQWSHVQQPGAPQMPPSHLQQVPTTQQPPLPVPSGGLPYSQTQQQPQAQFPHSSVLPPGAQVVGNNIPPTMALMAPPGIPQMGSGTIPAGNVGDAYRMGSGAIYTSQPQHQLTQQPFPAAQSGKQEQAVQYPPQLGVITAQNGNFPSSGQQPGQGGPQSMPNANRAPNPTSNGYPPPEGAQYPNGVPQIQQQIQSQPQQAPQQIQPKPIPMAQMPQQPQQLPAGPPGASPWHVGVATNTSQSPWHAGFGSSTSPVPPIQPGQPMQQATISVHSSQPAQKPFSNVDLLDGILDNTNLPPAMIPQPTTTQHQSLLRSCAPSMPVSSNSSLTLSAINALPSPQQVNSTVTANSSSTSVHSTTLQQGAPVQQPVQMPAQPQRPAAAVMPIQHQANVPPAAPATGMMANQPSTQAVPVSQQEAPRILPVTDLMDPKKFELGPSDKTRLEKRLLHEHIRSGGDITTPFLGVLDTPQRPDVLRVDLFVLLFDFLLVYMLL